MKNYSRKKSPQNVKREDIEKKLSELDVIYQDVTQSSRDMTKVAIGVAAVCAVMIAFYVGRKKALRKKMIVSFVRSR